MSDEKSYEETTGHLVTCLAVAGGESDPDCCGSSAPWRKPASRWAVETLDPVAREWVPGIRYAVRDRAVKRIEALRENHPTDRDGTPVKRQLVREDVTYTVETPEPQEGGGHTYLSTGCLHGQHDYCKSMTGMQGAKRGGTCKFCQARCICACHDGEETS